LEKKGDGGKRIEKRIEKRIKRIGEREIALLLFYPLFSYPFLYPLFWGGLPTTDY